MNKSGIGHNQKGSGIGHNQEGSVKEDNQEGSGMKLLKIKNQKKIFGILITKSSKKEKTLKEALMEGKLPENNSVLKDLLEKSNLDNNGDLNNRDKKILLKNILSLIKDILFSDSINPNALMYFCDFFKNKSTKEFFTEEIIKAELEDEKNKYLYVAMTEGTNKYISQFIIYANKGELIFFEKETTEKIFELFTNKVFLNNIKHTYFLVMILKHLYELNNFSIKRIITNSNFINTVGIINATELLEKTYGGKN